MAVARPDPLSERIISFMIFAFALFLSYDQRLHWDEATYLYLAAYYSPAQLLDHANPYFSLYSSRILYMLLLSAILSPGALQLFITQILFAFLLLGSIFVMYRIVILLPDSDKPGPLTYSTFCTAPVVMWLCFKIVPEVVALFCVSISILCLTLSISGGRRVWLLAAGVFAAATALTRNNLILMLISVGVALPFLYPKRAETARAFLHSTLAAFVAAASVSMGLFILKISPSDYSHSLIYVVSEAPQDFAAYAITLIAGLGLFWPLILVGMMITTERRYRIFCILVFMIPTLASLALLRDLETRYLISNLLGVFAITAITQNRLREISGFGTAGFAKVTIVGGAILLASGALSQRILEHRVAVEPLETILQAISQRLEPRVTLLTPDMETFHFLRVYAPDINVLSTHITPEGAVGLSLEDMQEMYGTRFVSTVEDLRRLRSPLVYLVAAPSFQVWEILDLLARIPLSSVRKRLSELRHRSLGGAPHVDWISKEGCINRKLLAEASEYRAYVLTVERSKALGCSE
jgi:hypothetical protein